MNIDKSNKQDIHKDDLFFFNDTATTEIYPLSLHDALPISDIPAYLLAAIDGALAKDPAARWRDGADFLTRLTPDRKITRLNSSHANISYAVFCLKKKNSYSRRAMLTVILTKCIISL